MYEQNKAIVRRLIEGAYNTEDLAVVDEVIASNYIHTNIRGQVSCGIEWVKQNIIEDRIAFPDLVFTTNEMVAEQTKRWFAGQPGARIGVTSGAYPLPAKR